LLWRRLARYTALNFDEKRGGMRFLALGTALAMALAACGPSAPQGCTHADASKAVDRLAQDLTAARRTGGLDEAKMREVSARMTKVGQAYSKTGDPAVYCEGLDAIRRFAGLPPAPR
jgi:hypothetical protein